MFKKILIANRGEIACRIIKTARKMGIATVAVYSDADADALHVEMADEAVRIGPAPSAQSYLVAERIIDACRATGAEAVHPGYGFLSEKAGFCAALQAAGITFIGPDPHAIAAMGDKIESKKLAHAAGVSTVPGHLGVIADDEEAVRIAHAIGYPVMMKASAGGGGKGMRVAWNDAETRDGFRSARNEARASFADDRVFIEKYIVEPRHIEIQLLADAHGRILYLNERECSIQRRHQKVIEEAPSPFLDAATRKAMGEQSVALARAVGYKSAGTVEFIVDRERNFYFLEMNTRLQVEHPVTEMIVGLDLVEQMIRIAAGEPLSMQQEEIGLHGWSIEARVYAEDPKRGFLPSIGRLARYRPPAEGAGRDGSLIRIDTGVHEGGDISMHYDPMIAKLIAWAPGRTEAARALGRALDGFAIQGVGHNIPFLASLVGAPRFLEGRLTTNFIAEEYPSGFHETAIDNRTLERLVVLAALLEAQEEERTGFQGSEAGERTFMVRRLDEGRDVSTIAVTFPAVPHGMPLKTAHLADGRPIHIAGGWRQGRRLWEGAIDGVAMTVQAQRIQGLRWRLTHGGASLVMQAMAPHVARLAALMPVKAPPDMSRFLLSPMPGLLVSIAVKPGDAVKAGQELAVIEAMKMENILRADCDGVIMKIYAAKGASLAVDEKILEFE
jgi:propionyl-CoA carboxylase alpha chain